MTRLRLMVCSRAALVLAVIIPSLVAAEAQPRARSRAGQRGREPIPVGTDEKAGPIEIKSVRMKQGSSGVFVTNGGSYNVRPGTPVDFEVEWKSENALREAPTLRIEWGFAASTSTSCGLCRITKTVPEGSHTIAVRMEDGKGGVTKRSFTVISKP